MKRIKVVIAADQMDFSKVIHTFLDRLPNVSIVGEAIDSEDVLSQVEMLFPDVVLMDDSMSLDHGFEATRIIKQHWPSTKVFITTSSDDPVYRKKTTEVQADGFIPRGAMNPSLQAIFDNS